jgi:DNA polymerase-3 subunit epsilon
MNANNLLTPGFLKELNTKVNLDIIRNLPEETGVYYFYDSKDELVYVGKSVNIKSRVISHFGNHGSGKALEMKQQVNRIDYELTGSELVALLKESDAIKRFQPLYNRSQKRTFYSYGITFSEREDGYQALRVERLRGDREALITFSTKLAAREYLFHLVERHELCQGISALYNTSGPCFQYTVHRCRGACLGEESAEEFNYRVQDAVKELTYFHRDFVILDKGRNEGEKSVVVIENGVYKGFGFVGVNEQVNHPRQFSEYISEFEDNRDVQQIIRTYINSKKVEKILEFD